MLDKSEDVSNNPYTRYKINLTTGSESKYTHYYNVETGYKIREISEISTPQGNFQQIIDMLDYKESDGIVSPHKLKQKLGDRTVELLVESVNYNTDPNDSLFDVE